MEEFPFFHADSEQLEGALAGGGDRLAAEMPNAIRLARTAIVSDREGALEGLHEECLPWLKAEGPALVHLAVKERASRCLAILLETWHIPVDGLNTRNVTPLFEAVSLHWLPGVRLLLEAKADVQGAYGGTPGPNQGMVGTWTILQHAVHQDNQGILEAIISYVRLSPNYRKVVNAPHFGSGMTPLLVAASNGNLACVKHLLANGADILLTDSRGRNVLHVAAGNETANIVHTLIAEFPLRVQCANAHRRRPDAICAMRQLCQQQSHEQATPLALAVQHGMLPCVKKLFTFCPEASVITGVLRDRTKKQQTEAGLNILHVAAMSTSRPVAEFFSQRLYEHDAILTTLVNDRTTRGRTPLHFAAKHQHTDLAFALLASGADLASGAVLEPDAGQRTEMDVLMHYLPNPVEFVTEVMTRAVTKHEKRPWISINFTLLNPRVCCRDVPQGSQGPLDTAAKQRPAKGRQAGPSSGANGTQAGLLLGTNSGEAGPLLDANDGQEGTLPGANSRETEPLRGTNPAEGQVDIELGGPSAGAGHEDQAHRHLDVVRELQKLAHARDSPALLGHVLLEGFLHLHWCRIFGPYTLLAALNLALAALLCAAAVVEGLVLKGLVSLALAPLLVHEAQCLAEVRCRAKGHWIATVLQLACFGLALGWLATDWPGLLVPALLLAWFQVAWLAMEFRQCHGFGRLVVHAVKKLIEYKEIEFGLVMTIATVAVTVQVPWDLELIECRCEEGPSIYTGMFTLALIVSCLSFVCFVVVLGYSCLTYEENYPQREKVPLIEHRVQFLLAYEAFLLGQKPRFLAYRGQGVVCLGYRTVFAAFVWISARFGRKWELAEPFPPVPQKCRCSCSTLGVPGKGEFVVFPEDLQRDLVLAGTKNRESIKLHRKAQKEREAKGRK